MARAAWGVTAAAILVSGLLAYNNTALRSENTRLSQRLASAEQKLASQKPRLSRSRIARQDESTPRPAPPGAPAPPERDVEDLLAEVSAEDLLTTPGVEHRLQAEVDQRLKEEIGARREQWMSRRRAELGEKIAAYAQEAEFSDEVTEEVVAIMDDALADSAEILRARREDHTTPQKADEDLAALNEDVRSELAALLGEEEADDFLENVRGRPKGPVGL